MKRSMIAMVSLVVGMLLMGSPVLADLSYSGGTVNGGAVVLVGTGLSLDPLVTTHWFEVIGFDTKNLLPADKYGGFRLRVVQEGLSPAIGPNNSTTVNIGVGARTYPDPALYRAGGNPLIQTAEWITDPWGEWMDPTHSHGFNPGDVTAKYDLAWQMVQVVSGADVGKWDILAYFRLTSGTGAWTSIYDGTQRTRYAFEIGDDAYLCVEAGDGFTGGYATYDGINTNATPEPATMALMALGGIGTLLRRRRNK